MRRPLYQIGLPNVSVLTKSEYVYRVLRENIVNGNLPPGTRLGQKWIAEELGVSDTPVREAIKRLQAEGLVAFTPHTGAEVARLDPADLEEVLAIRAVLEGLAVRTAVPNLTSEDIETLEKLMERMDRCVRENDSVEYGLLNQEFHKTIFSRSPYRRLPRMIEELWIGGERSRSVFLLDPYRMASSVEEHRRLVEALRRRDPDEAERLTKEHRSAAGRSLLASLARGGEHQESLAQDQSRPTSSRATEAEDQ